MSSKSLTEKIEIALAKALVCSSILLKKMTEINIEAGRRAYLASGMLSVGLKHEPLIKTLLRDALKSRYKDGSWGSIVETIACLKFLLKVYKKEKLVNSFKWLLKVQNKDGGWGRCPKDRSRIPVTFRLIENFYIAGEPSTSKIKKAYSWMEKEWLKDMSFSGLSYKAAGILIASKYYGEFSSKIIKKTIGWLIRNQNKDGGWGPNKHSPVGSVPSYTGLAASALIPYANTDTSIKNCIHKGTCWIIKNQISTGQWKEHPPENSLVECMTALNSFLNFLVVNLK